MHSVVGHTPDALDVAATIAPTLSLDVGSLPPSAGNEPTLWVPKTRPCRSSGMCVLVEDAGESVLSPDVEMIQSAGIGDRVRTWAQRRRTRQGAVRTWAQRRRTRQGAVRTWAQRRRTRQGAVRPVLVVERFELA
jgi:hypothetical protein